MSTGKYKIIGFVTAKCAVHYDRKSRLNWSHAEPRLQNQLTCPDKNSFTNIKSRLNSCVFFFECCSCIFFIFESKTFFLGEPLIDRESYYNLLSMNMLLQFVLLRGSGKIYGFSAHFRWKTSENSRMAQKNRLRIIFMGSLGGLFLHCRKIYIRLHWMA